MFGNGAVIFYRSSNYTYNLWHTMLTSQFHPDRSARRTFVSSFGQRTAFWALSESPKAH